MDRLCICVWLSSLCSIIPCVIIYSISITITCNLLSIYMYIHYMHIVLKTRAWCPWRPSRSCPETESRPNRYECTSILEYVDCICCVCAVYFMFNVLTYYVYTLYIVLYHICVCIILFLSTNTIFMRSWHIHMRTYIYLYYRACFPTFYGPIRSLRWGARRPREVLHIIYSMHHTYYTLYICTCLIYII